MSPSDLMAVTRAREQFYEAEDCGEIDAAARLRTEIDNFLDSGGAKGRA